MHNKDSNLALKIAAPETRTSPKKKLVVKKTALPKLGKCVELEIKATSKK